MLVLLVELSAEVVELEAEDVDGVEAFWLAARLTPKDEMAKNVPPTAAAPKRRQSISTLTNPPRVQFLVGCCAEFLRTAVKTAAS